jgi:hypothetical protein
MKCPICHTELVITGQARLETLEEHVCGSGREVSLKDKYECPEKNCLAHGIYCWNEMGEEYVEDFVKSRKFDKLNMAPYGSFQRQMNVEIYKKGLPDRTKSIKIGRYKMFFEYKYVADEDGRVLLRKKVFTMTKQDKDCPDCHIYVSNPFERLWWKMFPPKWLKQMNKGV